MMEKRFTSMADSVTSSRPLYRRTEEMAEHVSLAQTVYLEKVAPRAYLSAYATLGASEHILLHPISLSSAATTPLTLVPNNSRCSTVCD